MFSDEETEEKVDFLGKRNKNFQYCPTALYGTSTAFTSRINYLYCAFGLVWERAKIIRVHTIA